MWHVHVKCYQARAKAACTVVHVRCAQGVLPELPADTREQTGTSAVWTQSPLTGTRRDVQCEADPPVSPTRKRHFTRAQHERVRFLRSRHSRGWQKPQLAWCFSQRRTICRLHSPCLMTDQQATNDQQCNATSHGDAWSPRTNIRF